MAGIDEGRPVVVVGVSASESGRAAVRRGVEAARARGAILLLVRAWREIDRLYSMTTDELRGLDRAHAQERQILDDAVAEARRLDPDADIRAQLAAEDIYPALLAASADAALLVLGGGTIATKSSYLGEWFRTHAPCPTEVVPTTNTATAS